jgi:hypothetical protein
MRGSKTHFGHAIRAVAWICEPFHTSGAVEASPADVRRTVPFNDGRTFNLPGLPYDGDDPDGFASLREIQLYVKRHIEMADPPALLGVRATSVRRRGR